MTKPFLLKELLASLVVFLVALPLCMGVALASGFPPSAGLISGMIAGVVIGWLSGCPLQVSGPAAGLIAVVVEAIQHFGLENVGFLIILAGAIQLVIGIAGVASWFRAMSPAVIQGGLSGLGILIAAAQFHVMLDVPPNSKGLENLLTIPETLYKGLFPMDGSTHHLAALVGMVTLLLMAFWTMAPAKLKVLPAPLVAITASIFIAQVFHFPIQYIQIPDNLLSTLHFPSFSQWELLKNPQAWVAAFSIAFVSTIETVLTMIAIERLKPTEHAHFNRELKAQGIGNILCGALGTLPVAGVVIRSVANINAGAKTRLSAIFHGLWMLLPALVFPFVLESIPISALAALLVYTGCRLVNLNSVKVLKAYGLSEVGIFFTVMLATVFFNLLSGILLGIGLSLLKLLVRFTELNIREKQDSSTNTCYHFTVEGAATFIQLPKLASILNRVPQGKEIVLHLENLTYLDHACLDYLNSWGERYLKTGGSMLLLENGVLISTAQLAKTKGDWGKSL